MKRDQALSYVLIFIGLCIIASAVFSFFLNLNSHKTKVILGGSVILADVADSQEEQLRGLSEKTELADNEGMLFVYGKDSQHPIWMKDMKFSIDIIWLDADKKVTSITAGASPESFPQHYKPSKPARYVLEVPAGFVARENIKPGMIADFNTNAL